jgi:uncharacterized protein (UPF0332 family)
MLDEAEGMLAIHYSDAAGRTAYLAGFHAAQALISERTGRSAKTQKGVRTEFHQLIQGDTRFDAALRDFLGASYNLKAIADYETGPGAEVSPGRAREANAEARRFVTQVTNVLQESDPSRS